MYVYCIICGREQNGSSTQIMVYVITQFVVVVITCLILEIFNKLGKCLVKHRSGRLPSNSAEVSFLSRDGSAYLNVDSWYNFTRAQKERIAQYGQSAEMVGLAKTTGNKFLLNIYWTIPCL